MKLNIKNKFLVFIFCVVTLFLFSSGLAYAKTDLSVVEKDISHRAGVVAVKGKTEELVKSMLKSRRDEWLHRASTTMDGGVLSYNKYGSDRAVPLLKQPTEDAETLFFCLNSLRDVEPQIKLLLDDHDMDNKPDTKAEEVSDQKVQE